MDSCYNSWYTKYTTSFLWLNGISFCKFCKWKINTPANIRKTGNNLIKTQLNYALWWSKWWTSLKRNDKNVCHGIGCRATNKRSADSVWHSSELNLMSYPIVIICWNKYSRVVKSKSQYEWRAHKNEWCLVHCAFTATVKMSKVEWTLLKSDNEKNQTTHKLRLCCVCICCLLYFFYHWTVYGVRQHQFHKLFHAFAICNYINMEIIEIKWMRFLLFIHFHLISWNGSFSGNHIQYMRWIWIIFQCIPNSCVSYSNQKWGYLPQLFIYITVYLAFFNQFYLRFKDYVY